MDPLTTQNRLAIHNKIMLVKWNNKTQKVFYGVSKRIHFVTASGQKSAFDSDLFVGYKPHSKDPRDYFVPDSELPPLVQSGFNPSFIATVSHEKVQATRANLKSLMEEIWMSLMPLKDQHIMATVI